MTSTHCQCRYLGVITDSLVKSRSEGDSVHAIHRLVVGALHGHDRVVVETLDASLTLGTV